MKVTNSWQACYMAVAFSLLFILSICGCARIKEGVKCVAGVSTKCLEDGRSSAVKKTFAFDYATAYAKVKTTLKNKEDLYIYKEDKTKRMIAAYYSSADTTAVGIFLTEVDAEHTLVEVSSPSTYTREILAKRIFAGLEGIDIPEDEMEQTNAIKMP